MLPEQLTPFIEPMMAMCRTQFPRTCGACDRRFEDFEQWVRLTDPIGAPSLDEQSDADPFGIISWVNCGCGSTLILHCEDMEGPLHQEFMRALDEEAAVSERSVRDLLQDLRQALRHHTGDVERLQDPQPVRRLPYEPDKRVGH